MFYTLKQFIKIATIGITSTIYSMKQSHLGQSYYCIQTNDRDITYVSENKIKKMILLSELVQQRYKSDHESVSKPLQIAAINSNQLLLLKQSISASKDLKTFNSFYHSLTEENIGDLLNAASATATPKIICLLGSYIFPPEVQQLIITYDKKELSHADVKHALLTKIGPEKCATYTVPKYNLNALAWHPKGTHFLSWEKDHIIVHNSNTADIIQTFETDYAHYAKYDSSPILEYNSDGTFLISRPCALDGTRETTIWNGNEIDKKIKTFSDTYPHLTSFSSNNEQLVLTTGQKIILWNIKTDQIIEKKCPYLNVILFHPIVGEGFLTGGEGMKAENVTWRDNTGKIVEQLSTYDNNVQCAAISPDGSRIAIGHMTSGPSGRCILMDGITRKKIVDLKKSNFSSVYAENMDPTILAFSPDNKYLIAAIHDTFSKKKLLIWNPKNGAFVHAIDAEHRVNQLSFSSDSSLLFTSNNEQTIIYNNSTFKPLFQTNEILKSCTLDGNRFITTTTDVTQENTFVNVWKTISDKNQNILEKQSSDMFYNYRFNKLCRKLELPTKQSTL